MDQDNQQAAFLNDLRNVVARFMDEFDLSIVSALGAIEFIKLDLFQQLSEFASSQKDDEDDDSED